MARCGAVVRDDDPRGGAPTTTEVERNYDFPQNAFGRPMPSNVQAKYVRGSVVEVEVTLTVNRGGHFVFKGCPVDSTLESPTRACFDAHPLRFVSDELYGANPDDRFPERAYVAPDTVPNRVSSSRDGFGNATMVFRYRLRLPDDLVGDLVLLQWHYVASGGDACVHEGYDAYDWPRHWTSGGWDPKANAGAGLRSCEDVLPADGDGE